MLGRGFCPQNTGCPRTSTRLMSLISASSRARSAVSSGIEVEPAPAFCLQGYLTFFYNDRMIKEAQARPTCSAHSSTSSSGGPM